METEQVGDACTPEQRAPVRPGGLVTPDGDGSPLAW